MACKNTCRLCDRLVISESVVYTAGTGLVIRIPAGSYNDKEKYCIVVGQAIPETTVINAPVFIQIGTGAVLYPLTQPGCDQVTACGIKTRTRYATVVHTSADSGTFRLCKRVCCTTNNLRAINGDGTAVAPGPVGDDEACRFYRRQPRSKSSGRFMRRGDGRRNYTPYSYMMPEMYDEDAEYYRDMDRSEGRMYYSGDSGGAPNSNSGNGNYSGGRRGYGKTRFNDGTSTRYEMAKRNYTEAKELHNGNSTEDKQAKMKELEKYMSELGSDITEMISDASNEEKTLLKNKLQVLAQKVV